MESLISELNEETSNLSISMLEDDTEGMKEALRKVILIALLLRELVNPTESNQQ